MNLLASTAGRTVRLACEATGELNFKVFISRLIPRDFAVKWHATEIWKTLSTLSSTSSSSHRPNGQSPNNNCRIHYACFWSSSASYRQAAAKRQPQQKPGTNEDGEIDVTALDSAVAKRSIATRCFPTRTPKSNKIRQ
ncbi:Type II methyltransferase M.NgoBI [Trichinella spiralis]|uniref:Type II methyltransferase M.NgoBI n=1 Tax=Trichinella spiralis TaxID=6334 RepID=A0ABR3KUZ7_TRISP